MTLTVNAAPCVTDPAIEQQPKNATVTNRYCCDVLGGWVDADHCAAPSVQWYSEAPGAGSFSAISGATSPSYKTPGTTTAESGTKFEAVFKNAAGETTSDEVTLTVNPAPCSASPEVEEQPVSATVTEPAAATFSAAGTTPEHCSAPSVQWYSEAPGAGSFSAIGGATSPSYKTPATTTAESGTKFEAVFKNAAGETTSNEVTLTVNPPPCSASPEVEVQPKNATVTEPAAATFSAAGFRRRHIVRRRACSGIRRRQVRGGSRRLLARRRRPIKRRRRRRLRVARSSRLCSRMLPGKRPAVRRR